jgi:hypothetical protein
MLALFWSEGRGVDWQAAILGNVAAVERLLPVILIVAAVVGVFQGR